MKFHRISMIALLVATPLAFAQTSTQVQPLPDTTTLPAPAPAPAPAPQVIVLPEKVIETTVDLSTGGPQSGQSAYDARKEAVNGFAETRAACRRETRGAALTECLRNAQNEYNAVMAKTSGKHR